MYMLRLISAVLHGARGFDVHEDASDLRRGELDDPRSARRARPLPLGLAGLDLGPLVPAASDRGSRRGGSSDRGSAVIPTPKVDWLALSPTLALLGASGLALLGSVLVPWWIRRGFTAFVAFAGFVTAGVFAGIVFDESADAQTLIAESFTRDRLGALAAILIAGGGALTVLVSWGERRRRPRGRVLRAARGGRCRHGLLRHGRQPDDALPRARVVLDLPLHPLRARHAPRGVARGRAQVPDRRRLRLVDPALRLGARLRRDGRARLLADRGGGTSATTRSCSPGSRC